MAITPLLVGGETGLFARLKPIYVVGRGVIHTSGIILHDSLLNTHLDRLQDSCESPLIQGGGRNHLPSPY